MDVLAVHGYKWLMSPTGAGFMYVSPAFRKKLPPNIIGWRSHHDWRNVDRLHSGTPEFKDAAEKYEGGGLPFHLLYAMEASVDWMLEIGPEAIERRVMELANSTRSILRGLGAEVRGYRLADRDRRVSRNGRVRHGARLARAESRRRGAPRPPAHLAALLQ